MAGASWVVLPPAREDAVSEEELPGLLERNVVINDWD